MDDLNAEEEVGSEFEGALGKKNRKKISIQNQKSLIEVDPISGLQKHHVATLLTCDDDRI